MPLPSFDRFLVRMKPLAARRNKLRIEACAIDPGAAPGPVDGPLAEAVDALAGRVVAARNAGRPVMCAFGAHTIKNGLGPVLAALAEEGWVTHLATNGAGIIHDWEFSHIGQSSEDVRGNVAAGEFGNWEETGFFLNLALNVGAYRGLGYGESIGAMIQGEGLELPSADGLRREVGEALEEEPERAAAAADLLGVVRRFGLAPGRLPVAHPWKRFSVQAAAFRLGIPFTGHPMFGHDIIYNHPMNRGACVGRCAERDFLAFAEGVSRIEGGVYLSIGSAVMSPMVFEKSFSMAQNLALQRGAPIRGHSIWVADLAPSAWDWSKGEPPEGDPAYYLRYNKTFARMGGEMRYVQVDNQRLLPALLARLRAKGSAPCRI